MKIYPVILIIALLSLTGCSLVFPAKFEIEKDSIKIVDQREYEDAYSNNTNSTVRSGPPVPTIRIGIKSPINIKKLYDSISGTSYRIEHVLCDNENIINAHIFEPPHEGVFTKYLDPEPLFTYKPDYTIYDEDKNSFYNDNNSKNYSMSPFKYYLFLIGYKPGEHVQVFLDKKNNESVCLRIKGHGFFNAGFETNVIKIPGAEIDAAIDAYNAKRTRKE